MTNTIVRNQEFVDTMIDCDGIEFINCKFDGCILVRSTRSFTKFTDSFACWCKIDGAGWNDAERRAFAILQEAPTQRRHEAEVVEANRKRHSGLFSYVNRLKEADLWASRGRPASPRRW